MKITTENLEMLLSEVTPGEWVHGRDPEDPECDKRSIHRADGYYIAQVDWSKHQDANARLITLAPDLAREVIALRAAAEKLAEALRSIKLLSDCHSSREVAKSAILKAHEAQQ